jgi:hypothetical protein
MKNTFSMKEWLMMSELFSLARSDFIEATLAEATPDVDFAATLNSKTLQTNTGISINFGSSYLGVSSTTDGLSKFKETSKLFAGNHVPQIVDDSGLEQDIKSVGYLTNLEICSGNYNKWNEYGTPEYKWNEALTKYGTNYD